MSTTRQHLHEETFSANPEQVFAILHTPSSIRAWWGAARAIVLAQPGGVWVATWGVDEDSPDYITAAKIDTFDPPCRMRLNDFRYFAKTGSLPFAADFSTEFIVGRHSEGALLRVVQDGFPVDSVADEFYTACAIGWKNTFAGIRRFLEGR